MHSFEKINNNGKEICKVCLNRWVLEENAKLVACNVCGLCVHALCKSHANSCISCNNDACMAPMLPPVSKLPTFDGAERCGKVYATVLHAYDLPIPSQTYLYAMLKLSAECGETGGLSQSRCDTAVSGNHDCVWNANGGANSSNSTSCFDNVDFLSYDPTLNQKKNYKSSETKGTTKHMLNVQLWKNIYSIFDSMLGACHISLIPLLKHPGVITERWFPLYAPSLDFDPSAASKLTCVDEATGPPPAAPKVAPKVALSPDVPVLSEDACVSDAEVKLKPLPPISARPDLLIGEQHVDTAAPMAVVDDTVSPLHEFAESSAVVFENDNKKMESQKIEAEDDAEHIDEGELEQEMLRLEKIVQEAMNSSNNSKTPMMDSTSAPELIKGADVDAWSVNADGTRSVHGSTASSKNVSFSLDTDNSNNDGSSGAMVGVNDVSASVDVSSVESAVAAQESEVCNHSPESAASANSDTLHEVTNDYDASGVNLGQDGGSNPSLSYEVADATATIAPVPISPIPEDTPYKSQMDFDAGPGNDLLTAGCNELYHSSLLFDSEVEVSWSSEQQEDEKSDGVLDGDDQVETNEKPVFMFSHNCIDDVPIESALNENGSNVGEVPVDGVEWNEMHIDNELNSVLGQLDKSSDSERSDKGAGTYIAFEELKCSETADTTVEEVLTEQPMIIVPESSESDTLSWSFENVYKTNFENVYKSAIETVSWGTASSKPKDPIPVAPIDPPIPPHLMPPPPLLAVGKLCVDLESAHYTVAKDLGKGNTYVLLEIIGGRGPKSNVPGTTESLNTISNIVLSEKTQVIFNSASPIFNRQFEYDIPHYRSKIRLTLMEAKTDYVLGTCQFSMHSIMQRDAEDFSGDWKLAPKSEVPMRDPKNPNVTVGHFFVQLRFEEDLTSMFYTSDPRDAPSIPEEEMSLERLKVHIERFKAFGAFVCAIQSEYDDIMAWKKYPAFTLGSFVAFVYVTLYIDAEYALTCPLFLMIMLMFRSFIFRNGGFYKGADAERRWQKLWIEYGGKPPVEATELELAKFHPAIVRVAAIGYRNFPDRSVDGTNTDKVLQVSPMKTSAEESNATSELWATTAWAMNVVSFQSQSSNSDSPPHPATKPTPDGLITGMRRLPCFVNISYLPGSASSFKLSSSSANSQTANEGLERFVACTVIRKIDDGDMFDECGSSRRATIPVDVSYGSMDPSTSRQTVASSFSQIVNWTSFGLLQSSTASQKAKSKVRDAVLRHTADPWRRQGALVMDNDEKEEEDSSKPASRSARSRSVTSNVSTVTDMEDTVDISYMFPILLNPIKLFNNEKAKSGMTGFNIPSDCIKFSLFEQTPLADKPIGRDKVVGYIFVPLSTLLNNSTSVYARTMHDEVMDWFDVCWVNNGPDSSLSVSSAAHPQVKLRLQLDTRINSGPIKGHSTAESGLKDLLIDLYETDHQPTESNNAASDTISTIWHLRDHIGFVQNVMASLLDNLESFKNMWNWSSPNKQKSTPLLTRCVNFLNSVPNDDDIMDAYAIEHSQFTIGRDQQKKVLLRGAKLSYCLPCYWQGNVRVKVNSNSSAGELKWVSAFLLVQGHRLVWWDRESDVDTGHVTHKGQLLLFGQSAGTTFASPVDAKEMGGDSTRIIAVFGKDELGAPEKCTIVCDNALECENLVGSISKAIL